MKGTDFIILMRAERNLKQNFVLNAEEMRVYLAYGHFSQPKLCGYKGCTSELPPRVDGERHKIGGAEVCDDCYFDALGEELEKFPILPPRLRRRVA